MSTKEDVKYILKHIPSGMYLKDKMGREFTVIRSNAKSWEPNQKADEEYWRDLLLTQEYVVVKRTETITVEYEEVLSNE